MGRLLLKGGLTSKELRALLRRGADLDAVSCDGCGTLVPQEQLPERKEYLCPSCTALLLPFKPFLKRGQKATPWKTSTGKFPDVIPLPSKLDVATPAAGGAEADTLAFGNPEGPTANFDEVMTLPPDAKDDGTDNFDYVFVLPEGIGRRSEDETIMAMGSLVKESGDPGSSPLTLSAPSAPDGVHNRELAGTEETDPESMVGQLMRREIGGFTLIRSLGRGAVGRVFLARQKSTGRSVALKVLRSEAAHDKEIVARFEREAQVAALVKHPNAVGVVDAGIDEKHDMRFLALEYMEGGSLLDLLRDSNQLPQKRALEIVRGICLALEAAAAQGIVHRDIKPENILFSADGVPKLADLGLAKILEAQTQITETGYVVGTPCYIAPEQATGIDDIDIRADIFALGFCFWQMLTGMLPFSDREGEATLELVVRHIEEDLPDPRIYAHAVSDGAAQIVRGMAARDRDKRYSSPLMVVRDIDLILRGGQPLSASDSVIPGPLADIAASLRQTGSMPSGDATPDSAGEHLAAQASAPGPPQKKEKKSSATCPVLALLLLGGLAALAVWGGMRVHHWYQTGRLDDFLK